MKHNNFLFKIFFTLLISQFANNNQILAQKINQGCETYLQSVSPASALPLDEEKATFVSVDGQLYVSEKALVHGGKPVDTKKFKAPVLKLQNLKPGEAGSYLIIENFLHNGAYCTAKFNLDPNAIRNTYVQTMPFPIIPGVMAGHVQARFVMNPGFEIELLDPATLQTIDKVNDVIISYEAALPIGGSYNFALGSVDSSPLVGRVVSGSQKLSEGADRTFNQFKLPVTAVESSQLLGIYLLDAIQIKMDFYYNTIVRNCTTTIFDGIDKLERFAKALAEKKFTPFLTTIGGDPVIGPATNSLLARFGNEVEQVQDMKDEYQNILQSFGTPKLIAKNNLPFAPGGTNPMSLLVLTTGTENLTAEEKMIVDYMVEDIIHDLPETLNMLLASGFSLAEDLQSSPKIIQAMTDVISTKLKARITEMGTSLPNTPFTIQVQFTPYPSSGQGTDLSSRGFRAQLPFEIQRIDLARNNQSEVLGTIKQGIKEVDQMVTESIPAFLKNFSVNIDLQKDLSKVKSQFLIGLQPTTKGIEITNDQVALSQFAVPAAEEYSGSYWSRFKRAINPWASEEKPPFVNMLLSHEQDLQTEQANPIANIKFGSETELNALGQLEMNPIARGKYFCWSGARPHTPKLTGTLSVSPLGQGNWFTRQFNRILNGRSVTLSITELEMNLEEMKIQTTQLRVGAIGLRCLNIDSVNQQFGAQANEKLQELISKVGPAVRMP